MRRDVLLLLVLTAAACDDDDTSGGSAGQADPVCDDYADTVSSCIDNVTRDAARQDCEDEVPGPPGRSQACQDATRSLFRCQADATCEDIDAGVGCDNEDAAIENSCN